MEHYFCNNVGGEKCNLILQNAKSFKVFWWELNFQIESSISTGVVYRAIRTQVKLLDLLMERYTDLRELKMLDTSFTGYLQTNKVELGDLLQVSEGCN